MDDLTAVAALSTLENMRSASAVVTGRAAKMRSSMQMFGSGTNMAINLGTFFLAMITIACRFLVNRKTVQ